MPLRNFIGNSETVLKPTLTNQPARYVYAGLINPRMIFVLHNQPMVVAEPRDRSFDGPAAVVSSQLAAILPRFSVHVVWAYYKLPDLLGQIILKSVAVVSHVRNHRDVSFFWGGAFFSVF